MKTACRLLQLVFLAALTMFIFGGCRAQTTTMSNPLPTTTLDLDYADFPELLIDNPVLQLSMPEDDYYIYFYGRYCGHCLEIKNLVLTTIYWLEVDKVYIVIVDGIEDVNASISVTATPAMVHIVDHAVATVHQNKTNVLNLLPTLE